MINRNLEALAKQIYDYWFVQFDFPDENGNPYKSSGGKMVWNDRLKHAIPEKWESCNLAELGSFKNGINYSKDEIGDTDFKIVNVRNLSSSSIFIDNSDLDIISLKNSNANNYIVKDSDILIARSGIPGATRLLRETEESVIYCGFVICFSVKDATNKYALFFSLKQLESVTKTQSNGSILSNISQDVLKQLYVVLPNSSIKELFNEKINSIFSLIQHVQMEIEGLIKQRDELLPLLMNGQVNSDLSLQLIHILLINFAKNENNGGFAPTWFTAPARAILRRLSIVWRLIFSLHFPSREKEEKNCLLRPKFLCLQNISYEVNNDIVTMEQTYSNYTNRILNLRQAKIHGEVIVAKPVLLLALIDGIGQGIFKENLFVLNEWLEDRYLKLMAENTRHSQFDKPADIANPFWHLATDGFWHLHGKNVLEMKTTPSRKWLKENVSYAYFDEDLWILLQNQPWREKLRNFIVEQKLTNL